MARGRRLSPRSVLEQRSSQQSGERRRAHSLGAAQLNASNRQTATAVNGHPHPDPPPSKRTLTRAGGGGRKEGWAANTSLPFEATLRGRAMTRSLIFFV